MTSHFKLTSAFACALLAAVGEASGGTNTTPEEKPVIQRSQLTSKEFSFHFRTDKIRDDEGKVIGVGRKHPEVKAILPVASAQAAIEALQAGGTECDMILEAIDAMVEVQARSQINDWREANGLDKDLTATAFDLSKLTLNAIAVADKSGNQQLSDEDWTAFLDDYSHVMTQIVGYDPKKIKLHLAHLKVQLRRVKNDKTSVQRFVELLNVWASKTETLDDHEACYRYLIARATKYLKAEEKDLSTML